MISPSSCRHLSQGSGVSKNVSRRIPALPYHQQEGPVLSRRHAGVGGRMIAKQANLGEKLPNLLTQAAQVAA